jgi:hypothetical protein
MLHPTTGITCITLCLSHTPLPTPFYTFSQHLIRFNIENGFPTTLPRTSIQAYPLPCNPSLELQIYTSTQQRSRPPEDQERIQHRRLASDRMLSAISHYIAHPFPSHICTCTNVSSGWVENSKDGSDNFRRDGELSHEGRESWEKPAQSFRIQMGLLRGRRGNRWVVRGCV